MRLYSEQLNWKSYLWFIANILNITSGKWFMFGDAMFVFPIIFPEFLFYLFYLKHFFFFMLFLFRMYAATCTFVYMNNVLLLWNIKFSSFWWWRVFFWNKLVTIYVGTFQNDFFLKIKKFVHSNFFLIVNNVTFYGFTKVFFFVCFMSFLPSGNEIKI